MVSGVQIEGLGTTIFKAIARCAKRNSNYEPMISPVFRRGVEVAEALPDGLWDTGAFGALKILEGQPLQDVVEILNKADTSNPKAFVASIAPKSKSVAINPFSNSLSTTPSKTAQTRLAEFYDETARSAEETGNTKRREISSDFAARVRKGEFSEEEVESQLRGAYERLFTSFYDKIRKANYKTPRFDPDIHILTKKSTPLIEVREANGWHYRIPRKCDWSPDEITERVSVNAETDGKLIEALDNLFTSGKVEGYYKTPHDSVDWLWRHDPITIYLPETATDSTLKAIEKATAPYIRSRENVLIGKTFAPGLALESSPQVSDITNLLNEAGLIDSNLQESLRRIFSDRKDGSLRASSGQMAAAKELLAYVRNSSV